jgi:glycosyltransferase involved in cell wall biosynthesis
MHDAATAKPIAALRLARATALADWATRERITHLHAHWPYATQIAWLVNKLTKIPFSTSIHAHEVAHENGHFPQVFKTLSFATFCNRGAMNYLLKQLPAAAGAQSHLVYHGVDLSRFSPRPLPSFEAGLRIVTAGRLTATKGFDRLIRGCAQLRGQGVSTRLTILGRGAAETSLRDLSRELGFSEFLSMPGWVGHRDVKRYLTDAHIFALLADTTFHDGLPNVVLEAMACGRPILISRLPAADEAVSDGVEGFVVDRHEDPLAFAAAAGRIHRDHDLAARMGQAARSRVVRDHDADGQVLKLIELYRRRP